MNNIIAQMAQIKKYRLVFIHALLVLILQLSFVSTASAAYSLGDDLVGAFGDASSFVKSEVNRLMDESGIEAAATQAQTTLREMTEEAVPVIDELADPYQENAEAAITEALTRVQLATEILNKISGSAAERVADFLRDSPLFTGADFGMTTPTGRIRVHVQGTEVSICRTIIGPLGSLIVTGISNAENLCHFPDERMKNPTRSLLRFAYIAAGPTHIRVNQIIVPGLAADLTLLPAPINAETYVKTIGGQWVQIRLAGADPASIEIEAKFEVGLKGNISYYVDAEVEGEAAILIKTKPVYAAEVIRSTGEVMLNKAISLGLDMDVANLPFDAAAILQAGLEHLGDLDSELEEGLGETTLDVKITGGIGVGVWDTAISGISAGSSLSLTYPLHALIALRAGLLSEYLDMAMGMVNSSLKLGTSVIEGNTGAGLTTFQDDARMASAEFVNGVMQELLEASTHISMESRFKLVALGDADKEAIDIYESGLVLPVGDISASLQNNPNAFGDAFAAVSLLMLATVDPDVVITDQTWTDLEQVVVPGILYTLKSRSPATGTLVGFEEVDLLDTIKTIASIRNILINVARSSDEDNLNSLRSAIEGTITTAINEADDLVIQLINDVSIPRAKSFGANGTLGAEAVAEIGVKVELKGEVRGSLFLLLLGLDIYRAPEDGLLASASMPIDFSLDAGASAGEGVELTVDAGGNLSLNLFELTATHWDGDLPTPAFMEVAGFSVLEFDGVVNADESFSGSGILMLPMGGIVSADFDVDEFGNVISGSWSGGIELGPLGKFTWLSGGLDDDGLHGTIDVSLLGSEFNADFILQSSGLLLGSYEGALDIAGHQLAVASIYLGTDGQFSGQYQGDIDIGGFVANSDLTIDNAGFAGSSLLNVLGSQLVSTDLIINRSGQVSGNFTGQIVAGSHILSAVSLRTVNGGLVGTALMDLPGVVGAEVELRIVDGKVSAFYQGSLFNGLISQASFEVRDSAVMMSARYNISQFPGISSQVLGLVTDASALAQDQLAQAEAGLAVAQLDVDNKKLEIEAKSDELIDELEAAQQAVIVATGDAQLALNNLNSVIAEIDALNAAYAGLLNEAQKEVDQAQAAVDSASSSVTYYNNKIANLDRWYNGLSKANKAWYLAYYTAERAKLVTLRNAASAKLSAAKLGLAAAQAALDALNSEFADKLNPLTASKVALQATYDAAMATLAAAEQTLSDLNADIAVNATLQPLFEALDLLNATLLQAEQLVARLNGTLAMVEYAAVQGTEGAFSILSADVHLDLTTAMTQSSFEISARVMFLGQIGVVEMTFRPAEPVESFHQAVIALQSGTTSLKNGDVTAPQVVVRQAAEWVSDISLVELIASDNIGGSGVASISYRASGAQSVPLTTVAGQSAFLLIDVEGLIMIDAFATDINGNVSATKSVTVSIDSSGPQVSVTTSGMDAGVYPVVIKAVDLLGSGISYIAVSARGAENFNERIELSAEMTINLTEQGLTTLTISAVDIAGNITSLFQDVEVPDLSIVDDSGDGSGSGGGAMDLSWMLFALIAVGLRSRRRQGNHYRRSA